MAKSKAKDTKKNTADVGFEDQLWNAADVLRGNLDVKVIMPIALVSYWLLNLPVGYLLGFTLGMGPTGLYLGFAVGLSSAAVLLIRRIRRSVRKLRAGN